MSNARPLLSLDDEAARAEARRLIMVAVSRWEQHAAWFGLHAPAPSPQDEGPSPLEVGMLAMFRYARGEDVPAFIVQSFIDELLALLFAGLASGALALPRFERMRDRPWAVAWRAAELRLKAESDEPVSTRELAHLLDVPVDDLVALLAGRGVPTTHDGMIAATDVPGAFRALGAGISA